MAPVNEQPMQEFGLAIRRHLETALGELVDSVVNDLVTIAQRRIENEAREYAARTVLTLIHVAEIREAQDRIIIELRLPPKDGQ